jgi:peptidyl-prolyl cis-trans isomerase C
MKSLSLFLFIAAVWAQPSPAPPPSDPNTITTTMDVGKALADSQANTVVATFGDGQKLTAGELSRYLAVMPANMQQAARRDRKAFVQQFALMIRLSEMGERAQLDQQSPTRDALAFNRIYLLMNAELQSAVSSFVVSPADVQTYYDANKTHFAQVKVKALYIAFASSSAPGAGEPKRLTEAEAQAKIAKLHAALSAGADFVKLVKENSDDKTSAAKDGDFGTLHSSDKLPDAIRTAVFALKPGEVSQPVKQPNGFYLFRAEEVSAQPLAEVHEAVLNDLKQVQFKKWMDEVNHDLNFKITNQAFFSEGGAAPAGK